MGGLAAICAGMLQDLKAGEDLGEDLKAGEDLGEDVGEDLGEDLRGHP